jgi:ubiquinone/menaquinone biosynthesis C-methylase UbiE
MSDRNVAFIGSIPQNYDRYLGQVYFHHYADDLSARLEITPGMRVLEVACGTGIVTERLVLRLAGPGTVVATDLNEPMLAYARQKARDARMAPGRRHQAALRRAFVRRGGLPVRAHVLP